MHILFFLIFIIARSWPATAQQQNSHHSKHDVFIELGMQPLLIPFFGPIGASAGIGVRLTDTADLAFRLERGAYLDDPFGARSPMATGYQLFVFRMQQTIWNSSSNIDDFGSCERRACLIDLRDINKNIFMFFGLGRRLIRGYKPSSSYYHSVDVDVTLAELGVGLNFLERKGLYLGIDFPGPLIPISSSNLQIQDRRKFVDEEEKLVVAESIKNKSKQIIWNALRLRMGFSF